MIQEQDGNYSLWKTAFRKFSSDWWALIGLGGITGMFLLALCAPLLANGRPLLLYRSSGLEFPFLYYIFSPDSPEIIVEKIFNFLLLFLPLACLSLIFIKKMKFRAVFLGIAAVLILIPFILMKPRLDKTNWRDIDKELSKNEFAVFAPIPYGPFENISTPYEKMSWKHWFGTDKIGRDILARMLYGARVSLAVGIIATGLALIVGVIIGMIAGYFGGGTDIIIMRIVEIIICFPTFLLLLILMSIMLDYKFEQSILLVIVVIGLTGWTGLCRLVRGEVLKQRALPYILSCESIGLPTWRIMLFHLLPNVTGPILVSFTFGVAGAVLAESGLSFLGFGVQPPTASWGKLLRQAFDDPFTYWHLTLWPGLAIFILVCAFNFTGEGLRKVISPDS